MPAPTSTCHGVRRPEYRPVPGLGGSAGDRSDDQCPDPIGPGEHAAPFGWPDANQGVAFERKVLARFKLEHAAALERDVHLLLAVLRVVVPGMAGGIRREIRSSARRSSSARVGRGPFALTPERWPPSHRGAYTSRLLSRAPAHRVVVVPVRRTRWAARTGLVQPQQGMLPGVLAPDLVAVFVGTSVSTTSAEEKHYYAHPSKPLLGAPGCGRAYESCRFVQ